ncbi:neuronal acetylcholine receptor subunit alpha-2-like [Anopheles maculipalpis]|uniref:neuronal acetylcholine receptor subunit alpha-2-like n=1 Tax=Anopheles maculipalpis TaxID=1496333 RepID=UPI002159079A|nr:neuronal acetylcholine receptor subunit alpha-2-like [Anopheles maculipalpis]
MGSVILMLTILLLVLVLLQTANSYMCNKETSNADNLLKQHLLCNGYDPKIRPAKSEFDTINITVIAFVYNFDVEIYSSTMDVQMKYWMIWNDPSLRWNASDWSNITMLRLKTNEIWFPQFEHINADYEGEPALSCSNPHCSLYDTGRVVCVPICSITTSCTIDFLRWPYSTMECQLWFSNHDKELIDEINFVLEKKYIATYYTNEHGDWCMPSFQTNQTMLDIPGATKRSVLLWKFGLRQTPYTALVTIYFPTFVLVMLNIFICWLHSHASEKTKMILLSLVCHSRLLSDMTVISSDVPTCLIFMLTSMVMTALLFVITLILRWLNDLHSTPPKIIKRWTVGLTNTRVMDWFLRTEYLSLVHKPIAITNYVELRDWPMIVRLVDRSVFVLYAFIYLLLFWIYIPLQHDKYDSDDVFGLCAS